MQTAMATSSEASSEPRQKGRPSREEAAAIDRAIRDAALAELLARGEAATLNAVAQAAGLSRKTVYARYSNKTELFREVAGEVLANAGPIPFEVEGGLQRDLERYFVAVFRLLDEPHAKAFQHALTMNPNTMSDLQQELVQATRTIFLKPLLELLTSAQARGELVSDATPAEIAHLGAAMALGDQFMMEKFRADETDPQSSEVRAKLMARLIARASRPK